MEMDTTLPNVSIHIEAGKNRKYIFSRAYNSLFYEDTLNEYIWEYHSTSNRYEKSNKYERVELKNGVGLTIDNIYNLR